MDSDQPWIYIPTAPVDLTRKDKVSPYNTHKYHYILYVCEVKFTSKNLKQQTAFHVASGRAVETAGELVMVLIYPTKDKLLVVPVDMNIIKPKEKVINWKPINCCRLHILQPCMCVAEFR